MEGGASASDMSAIWAALQAADDGLVARAAAMPSAMAARAGSGGYAVAGFTDDAADEEDEEEDEEEDDDEMAPVMPQRIGAGGGTGGGGGGGLLPPSFYSASSSGLPDVVPAFLLPAAHRAFGGASHAGATASAATGGASSSSETFLDDILRSHDEPFGAAAQRLTPERLSQLEDNYERKKKRAKINRRDLNSRFQELMDLLRLKEDRKLNRAKVLEKAIEQIHKLSDELSAARLQLQRHAAAGSGPGSGPGSGGNGGGGGGGHGGPAMSLPLQMPLPMPQWTPGVSLAAAAPHMMWMPMLPPAQVPPVAVASSSRPSSARARSAGTTKTARATATPRATVSMQTQTSPERPPRVAAAAMAVRRPGLKRGRETATATPVSSTSSLVWVAQEVPALLELCDAWTLRALTGVSRGLRAAGRRDALWQALCTRRWRLEPSTTPLSQDARALWTQLDRANEMPRCLSVTGATVAFAAGRRGGIALWASLVRRSNGRTTRTVLVDGKAVVRQVVELNVVVQNLDARAPLRLTDALHVCANGGGAHRFELLTSDSRAHLAPHLVTVNDVPRGGASVAGVELFHGDFCVLSVFVACDGLDLEQQFLDRVDGVEMHCERRQSHETLCVTARACHDKHARIADAYGSSAGIAKSP